VYSARTRYRRTLKTITHHSQPHTQADNETNMQHNKSFSILATVPWCRYHLGHCGLFYVFLPKVGGASGICFNLLYMVIGTRPPSCVMSKVIKFLMQKLFLNLVSHGWAVMVDRFSVRLFWLWTYRVAQKNGTIFFLYALTLPNINRFSKFFHYQSQEKICNNTVAKDLTTPQVCRYTTLWNDSVLKQQLKTRRLL